MRTHPLSKCFLLIGSLLILQFFLSACTSRKKLTSDYYLSETPPNGIKIGPGFFYDQSEISNLSWMEYMHWVEVIYGKSSPEFKTVLPDTACWHESSMCLFSFTEFYLKHPSYRDYPATGITQKQARDFSNWRSDRVFEYLLIREGIIDWNMKQNRDTFFTTEKYFKGQYMNYKPDTSFVYYPVFRLPTLAEYKKALHYTDSIEKGNVYPIQAGIIPCKNDTFKMEPMVNATSTWSKKKKTIYHLKGNVREWISDPGICVGGGWADKKETVLVQDTFHSDSANAWTGFRNVCEWKKWTNK